MDPRLWEMQQAAERRVERMREQSRLIAQQQSRRTADSMRAARPTFSPPAPIRVPEPPAPCPHPAPPRQPDPERRMLLLLTLLLARSGASADLLLVLLYLAL